MVPTEYTDRIVPDEAVYLAPNGRFHRPGCRYYVAPGPEAIFVEGTFTQAFLANCCKLCFPGGIPAVAPPQALAEAPPAPPRAERLDRSIAREPRSPGLTASPAQKAEEQEAPPLGLAAPASATAPEKSEAPEAPEVTISPSLAPEPTSTPAPTAAPAPERQRRRKRSYRGDARPPAVTKLQIVIFLGVVLTGVGLFVALASLLHWFG